MEIKKHVNSNFGSLTTIKSPSTGKVMFIGKEVGEQWGHTNIKQAAQRLLDETEKIVVKKSQHAHFFRLLVSNKMLPTKAQTILLVSESGLYKLALASNLEKAQPFRDWVTKEVLPSIRENGFYSFSELSTKEIASQTLREVQLNNSKRINAKNFLENGVKSIIDYNKANCKQVTGLEPNQIKSIAGKKSKSAKEILRETNPELAATMSLNDHFVLDKGAQLAELKKLDEAAVKLFKEVNKLGFKIID
jgi:prophage antirepressor-like protein